MRRECARNNAIRDEPATRPHKAIRNFTDRRHGAHDESNARVEHHSMCAEREYGGGIGAAVGRDRSWQRSKPPAQESSSASPALRSVPP
jgi:hypothetical protein